MFKLRLQFFFAMLIICSLLTIGLNLIIRYNFHQDFWQYIELRETRFAQPLIEDLTAEYREHNNWQWVSEWDSYIVQRLRLDAPRHKGPSAPPPEPPERFKEPGNNDAHAFREWHERRHIPPIDALRSLFLLDASRTLIAGRKQPLDSAFIIPLKNDGKTVGYLGIPFNPVLRDLQDSHFAQAHEKKLTLVIIVALILASLASIPLSHLLTSRINQLVAQVMALSKGNYQRKISIKGNDEISVLAQHLNNLAETLAQSESTRRQWVADISHELRTPLAVLQAELEAMEDGVRPINTAAIAQLKKHFQRLAHLVNDLYELSLTDLGGLTYRKSSLDVTAIVQEAVSAMQQSFSTANITLTLHHPEKPILLFADANRLLQLLTNLLKNSLQYTNTPGTTQVTLTADKTNAIVVVEDSPPGVSEEHHKKLFDRLYRGDSSRNRSTGGAGLGLSICKNIVNAHEGTIAVNHSQLGGLKVTLTLPLLKEKP